MKSSSLEISTRAKLIINAFLAIFTVFCLFPLIMLISISLSNETDILQSGFSLIPRHVDVSAYNYIFKSPFVIINAYEVTIFVTVAGTFTSLLLTAMLAYTLSRNDFKYKSAISFYIFITMLFSGGLVPWYILISRYFHMTDKIIVLIIPYLIVPWYVFLMRTYFQKIPSSLIESAKIDGSSEIRIFVQIIIPLSGPSLATVGLFIAMMYWNDWWLSLLYINKPHLYSLQMLLRNMMYSMEAIKSQMMMTLSSNITDSATQNLPSESMRMAMCMIAIGPIVILFPFLQKYFVQGLTIGAIKG